jgi:hypothetical protein
MVRVCSAANHETKLRAINLEQWWLLPRKTTKKFYLRVLPIHVRSLNIRAAGQYSISRDRILQDRVTFYWPNCATLFVCQLTYSFQLQRISMFANTIFRTNPFNYLTSATINMWVRIQETWCACSWIKGDTRMCTMHGTCNIQGRD